MKRRPLITILIGAAVVLCLCSVLSIALNPSNPSTPASAPASAATVSPTQAATDQLATDAPVAQSTAAPVAAATPAGYIAKDTVDFTWPFTIAAGRVACLNGNHVVFFGDDGNTYAVNGTARGAIKNGEKYKDFQEIWLDNPDTAGMKINIGPVIDIGLALCK